MPFQRGHEKSGGRKLGVPNKTTLKFRQLLETEGICVERELAEAIRAQNVPMIQVLTNLLPYLTPKLSAVEVSQVSEPSPETRDVEALATVDLKALASGSEPSSK